MARPVDRTSLAISEYNSFPRASNSLEQFPHAYFQTEKNPRCFVSILLGTISLVL